MAYIDTRPPCKEPLCKERADKGGYCLEHVVPSGNRHKRYNRFGRSKEKLKVYSSQRWKKLSKRMLSKYPICTKCDAEGKIVLANLTDHLFGFTGETDPNAWDENCLYPLCTNCHAAVTAMEKHINFLAMPLTKAVELKYSGANPHYKGNQL